MLPLTTGATVVVVVVTFVVGVAVVVFVTIVAVPVAVKVTGEPVSDPFVAVSVFDPAVEPSVQLPTVAIPFEPVVADALVTAPPPVATAKVTLTPLTVLLFASFTMTLGNVVTDVFTVAD